VSELSAIYDKCLAGGRLTLDEGLTLYRQAPLLELGDLAHQVRMKRLPGSKVTFVLDTNLNYTNVCDAFCTFCAFYRTEKDEDKYTYTVPEMIAKIKQSVKQFGVTTVLIQGGLNPKIPFSYYTDFVSAIRREVPEVHPHLYSAPEIWKMVEVTGKDIRWVLTELYKAGLDTLPGGGAEILTDRVRLKLSRTKVNTENWLKVHEIAHEIGYRSTATMMFGHLDEDVDILQHLESIRAVQERTGGFTAFIPWSFKPDNTALARRVREAPGAGIYLRILALSRLFLDNFDHVQASWFSEGKKTGQMALYYGADDFGGTIFEENVLFSANHECKTTLDEITKIIREAGFIPAQRSTKYEIVKTFAGPESIQVPVAV
jgi:cyclic dehypoxanthinyl futalosine synthase